MNLESLVTQLEEAADFLDEVSGQHPSLGYEFEDTISVLYDASTLLDALSGYLQGKLSERQVNNVWRGWVVQNLER